VLPPWRVVNQPEVSAAPSSKQVRKVEQALSCADFRGVAGDARPDALVLGLKYRIAHPAGDMTGARWDVILLAQDAIEAW
jgi:hypothetical protein